MFTFHTITSHLADCKPLNGPANFSPCPFRLFSNQLAEGSCSTVYVTAHSNHTALISVPPAQSTGPLHLLFPLPRLTCCISSRFLTCSLISVRFLLHCYHLLKAFHSYSISIFNSTPHIVFFSLLSIFRTTAYHSFAPYVLLIYLGSHPNSH